MACLAVLAVRADAEFPRNPGAVRFALCQTPAVEADSQDPVAEVFDWVDRNLLGDEDVVVLPELAFVSLSDIGEAWRTASDAWESAAAFAVERDVWVFANHPSREGGEDAPLFNETRVFAPDGSVAAVYRKRVLANMDRAAGYSAGTGPAVFRLPFGRIGMLICKDAKCPQRGGDLYAGADLLLVQIAQPGVDDPDAPEADVWTTTAEARDEWLETRFLWDHLGIPYLAVGKTGPEGVFDLCGGSFVSDGDGTVVAEAGADPEIVVVDVPLGEDGRFVRPPPFAIVLDPAGGSVPVVCMEVERGEPFGELPRPVRKGHRFLGWFEEKGGGPAIGPKDVPTNDGTLFARWEGVVYSLVLKDPASGRKVRQKFRYGTAKPLVKQPFSRSGYVLVGWSKEKGGKLWIRDGAEILDLAATEGKEIPAYAVWAVRKYKVSFRPNGGTGAMAAQTFVYGRKQNLRANAFKRTGHTFVGWARKPSAGVTIPDKRPLTALTKNGGTVPLYAKWRAHRCTVRFDPNGGTGSMADEAFVYGQAKKLRANAFSRSGYRFLGWSKSRTATRATWKDRAAAKNLSAKDSAVVVLYAVWIKDNDPDRILCLGDSITEGYACAGLPYPARLARLAGRKVVNRGVGGTTSRDGLRTAEENILSARAGTVCILFGANDAIHGVDPATTKENLRKIVRLCRENGCTPVLGTPPHQSGSHARFDDGVSVIVAAIRALAREEGVALADVHAAFGHWDGYLNPDDGLHLSDAGGDLLARLFRRAL